MRFIELGVPQFDDRPVLLVWGMQDPVLTPAVLARWQKVLPHAETHSIDDAGHFVQEDAPERVVDLLLDFLRRHQ